MKLLTFQARRFRWKTFQQNSPDADAPGSEPGAIDSEVADAVAAFVHAESKDEQEEERARVFRKTLKHVKWLANKRELKTIVLHSFTHLGAENADAAYARALLVELDERLTATGYDVHRTPFGWFCEWEISVFGESLAKVWKEF